MKPRDLIIALALIIIISDIMIHCAKSKLILSQQRAICLQDSIIKIYHQSITSFPTSPELTCKKGLHKPLPAE